MTKKKKYKKAFTLIELLAVIVILAIIALIAMPIVMNLLNKTRQKSAENSAYSYMKGIEYYIGLSELEMNPKRLEAGVCYNVNDSTIINNEATEKLNNLVDIKGRKPTGLKDHLCFDEKYTVKEGILTINGYTIEIKDGKVINSIKGAKINVLDFTLNVDEEVSMERGKTFTIKANSFDPSNASNQKLLFKSKNEDIITVDSNGKVEAIKNGEGTIVVTSEDNNSVKKEIKITVESPHDITEIEIKKESEEAELYVGKYLNLIATIQPSDAQIKTLTWTSSNDDIATVDETGKVFGKSIGKAIITATSESKVTATIEVEVKEILAESITISGNDILAKDEAMTLSVTISPQDTTNQIIAWTSSDESIATVDETGNITGIGYGTVTITATTSNGKNMKKQINVYGDFATDSWETIIKVANENKYTVYSVGSTKTVDMGTFGTHTVRISNTTACDGSLQSETACGFVIEFADIITSYSMNNRDTNEGGWPATLMRTYLNNTIYNALPADLRSGIIDTKVISGHGSTSGETNFESTDKLYLLSTAEVWDGGMSWDTAKDSTITKQLDYYTLQTSTGIKNYGSVTYWWLRTPGGYSKSDLWCVNSEGGAYITSNGASNSRGVSPAFRLAN